MYVTDIVRAIVDDLQGHECMNKVNVEGPDIASICKCVLFISYGPFNGNGKLHYWVSMALKQLMVRVRIRVGV